MKILFLVVLIISMPLFFGGCENARGQWDHFIDDVKRI